MNKSRRDFLKKLPLAMSIPFTIANVPLRVLGESTALAKMAAASNNDRVLIILQMAGGNDGLNCLIPVEKYDEYYSRRANIAIPKKDSNRKYIPLDSTIALDAQVGLHPDMQAMKAMYDIGRLTVVQGVSYKNNNGSHFRGRDIWFMGGSADDYYQSGWVGRYLQGEFVPKKYPEDFPNPDMLDPLAIEMGNDVSLIFHQQGNIPTSISINDPASFAELVGELEGFQDEQIDPRGIPPEHWKGSPYYNELEWILSLEDKSKDYAQRLYEVYLAGGASAVTYPETYPFNAPKGSLRNPLSGQLKLIARMLAGGCKTKVFLVKVGGFDTHADQVEKLEPTMGGHAALMYHISTAMSAFQDDLRARGLEDRTLSVTTSEFGRRIDSNGSFGTDHGTGGPLFIFGKGVQPGVVGKVPDLSTGNVEMQFDYRLIYGNIMRDWMLVDDTRLNEIFPGLMTATGTSDGVTFEALPLAQQTITGTEGFIGDRFALKDCYPNPAKEKTTVSFMLNGYYQVNVNLMNTQGKIVKAMVDGMYEPGEHKIEVDISSLPAGAYVYQLKTGFYKEAKKLIIVK
ncbi:MAG: DUF1501 domain-containing protein [Chryseolinea sp.]